MKYLLLLTLILTISCERATKYSDNGFDYPVTINDSDTNLYSYQLKDIASKRDAFWRSYYYLFYRPFEEPNLSLKPQLKDTYRLTYSTAFGHTIIITFNEDELIIKKGKIDQFYDTDTTRLTSIENLHLDLLKRYYAIDTSNITFQRKKYLDSLVLLYPELTSSAYYHKLFDKSLKRNDTQFQYQKSRIDITIQQYELIVKQIDSSGYWTLPFEIKCDDPPMDGHVYTLEVNTAKKYKTVQATGCPSDNGKFPKICQKIISLAKLDNEINLDSNWETIEAPSNE